MKTTINKNEYSVIIPLFNKREYILRAISSVFTQNHNVEIIVIDDGSTDDSISLVNSLKDDRIKIISQTNQGAASARNRGIEQAIFNYLAFLDADDEWLPGYLSAIDILIRDYPGCGLYAASYRDQFGDRIHEYDSNESEPFIGILNYFEKALNEYPFCTSSVVLNKRVFINVEKFNESIWLGEDLDLWGRIALNYQIAYTSIVYTIYHHNTVSQTIKRKLPIINNFVHSLNRHLESNPRVNDSVLKYANHLLINAALLNIINGHPKSARLLIYDRPSDKYLFKILLCLILSLLPRKIFCVIKNTWNKIKS